MKLRKLSEAVGPSDIGLQDEDDFGPMPVQIMPVTVHVDKDWLAGMRWFSTNTTIKWMSALVQFARNKTGATKIRPLGGAGRYEGPEVEGFESNKLWLQIPCYPSDLDPIAGKQIRITDKIIAVFGEPQSQEEWRGQLESSSWRYASPRPL